MAVTLDPILLTDNFGEWRIRTNEILEVLQKTATLGVAEVNSGILELQDSVSVANSVITDVIVPLDIGANRISLQADIVVSGNEITLNSASNTATSFIMQQDSSNTWLLTTNTDHSTLDLRNGANFVRFDTAAGLITAAGFEIDNDILPSTITANLVGSVTGNIIGDLIGDVTGDLEGDVTGGITVPSGKNVNFENADSVSLPSNFGFIPQGGIIMWSGVSIPSGWALCNGSNGTPDLRNRFIVGSGGSYAVAATGGLNEVTLDVTNMPSHAHTINAAGAHVHTINSGGDHQHTYQDARLGPSPNDFDAQGGGDDSGIGDVERTTERTGAHIHTMQSAGNHTHTMTASGGGTAHENRPPYYALAFIMKL